MHRYSWLLSLVCLLSAHGIRAMENTTTAESLEMALQSLSANLDKAMFSRSVVGSDPTAMQAHAATVKKLEEVEAGIDQLGTLPTRTTLIIVYAFPEEILDRKSRYLLAGMSEKSQLSEYVKQQLLDFQNIPKEDIYRACEAFCFQCDTLVNVQDAARNLLRAAQHGVDFNINAEALQFLQRNVALFRAFRGLGVKASTPKVDTVAKTAYASSVHTETLQLPSAETAAEYAKELFRDENILYVEKDSLIGFTPVKHTPQDTTPDVLTAKQLKREEPIVQQQTFGGFLSWLFSFGTASNTAAPVEQNRPVLPNDPLLNNQWYLQSTKQVPGSTNFVTAYQQYTKNFHTPREPVVVAVLDSGIMFQHEDVKNQIWDNKEEICDNGKDDDNNGYVDDCHGWNFVSSNNKPEDGAGHGTSVSALIAAEPNNKLGITPMCWHCKIMPLKVLDDKLAGFSSSIITAIDYAVTNKARISNNSYGAKSRSDALSFVYKRAEKYQMVFVGAGGNEGLNLDASESALRTADTYNVISVASVDRNGEISSFSNYGTSHLTLAAPGGNVLTATTEGYKEVTGTSFAAPLVAGFLAQALALNPNYTYEDLISLASRAVRVAPSLKGKVSSGGYLDIPKGMSLIPGNACEEGYQLNHNDECEDINECLTLHESCPDVQKTQAGTEGPLGTASLTLLAISSVVVITTLVVVSIHYARAGYSKRKRADALATTSSMFRSNSAYPKSYKV